MPVLRKGVVKKSDLCGYAPEQFFGCGKAYDRNPRVWGVGVPSDSNEVLTDLRKRFEEAFDSGDTAVKSASYLAGAGVYRPNVYVSGAAHTMPVIVGMVAAAVFCDILAEELGGLWDRGFYRYVWAVDPMAENDRFNLSVAERKAVRGSPIAKAAKRAAYRMKEAINAPNVEHAPELQALFDRVRKGEIEVTVSRGRPRNSATGKTKVGSHGKCVNNKFVERTPDEIAKLVEMLNEEFNRRNRDVMDKKINELEQRLSDVYVKVQNTRHDLDARVSELEQNLGSHSEQIQRMVDDTSKPQQDPDLSVVQRADTAKKDLPPPNLFA